MTKSAQHRRVDALIARLEPKVEQAFIDAMQTARNDFNVADLIAALETGDVERAAQALRIEGQSLWALDDAIRTAYMDSATSINADLPSLISGGFGFNGRHIRAEQWTRNIGSDLIQGITDDSLEVSRKVITQGLRDNIGTKAIARSLIGKKVGKKRVGGFLGLTSEITDSIITGRSKLASGDPKLMREYLSLKLRDKRHDKAILKAIDAGEPITGRKLDAIMQAHQSTALTYRGKVIARNEVFTAQAAGREESYLQLVESGKVESANKRWQHNLSKEPRLGHVAMDGERRDIREDFVFPDGTRMSHPHDPRGGARHSISCRCICVYRIKIKRSTK